MTNLLRIFALLFGLAFQSYAHAQITYDGCIDIRGLPVASISDPSINDVAMASLAPDGAPIIRYNPRVLSWMHPQTRLFFYAHECGHHARGHNFGTVHPMAMEQDADCFAIKTLVDHGMLDDSDITVIQNDIANAGRADWTHLPGPQRAMNLRLCLSSGAPITTPSRPQPLSCCDAYGNKWCQIVVNPGPLGSPCFCNGVPGYGLTCR